MTAQHTQRSVMGLSANACIEPKGDLDDNRSICRLGREAVIRCALPQCLLRGQSRRLNQLRLPPEYKDSSSIRAGIPGHSSSTTRQQNRQHSHNPN